MKGVKPGRGPSMLGGIVGLIMVGCGILWTVFAADANGFFALFGVLWTCAAIAMTVYQFRNATRKHRYSAFDITDDGEEPDPLNERYGAPNAPQQAHGAADDFCPYCGAAADAAFAYCRRCGKKLP